MGKTTIDNSLAIRIAEVSDVTTDDLGSAIVEGRQVLTAESPTVAQALNEKPYHHLGIDLGPVEILTVEGKKVHAWTQTPTAFAA